MGQATGMPRSLLFSIVCIVLIVAFASPLVSAAGPDIPSLEDRAKKLDKQLICPVCPGETLHQSQATLAKQMRALIREQLASGQSQEEILEYFVSVYGQSVLAAPPKQGAWLLVWLIPGLGMIGGITIVFFALRSMRRPHTIVDQVKNPKAPQSYLDLIDDEIRSTTDGMDQGNTK